MTEANQMRGRPFGVEAVILFATCEIDVNPAVI
jgi:hypothetical protein